MSKIKEHFHEEINNRDPKFLDDDYQEQKYQEENRMFGSALIVSVCCKAPFSVVADRTICTKCHNFCDVK